MTENVEEQLTVEDILSEAGDAAYHTILRVWSEVLEASKEVRKEKVTPQWATRVISGYTGITFSDMENFKNRYYSKIDELFRVLQAEIDTDDECLNHTSADEDVENNTYHYLNVIIGWQKTILLWELAWTCTDSDAAVELAAISEVHKMFFGEVGLSSLLDQINFEFSEESQTLLRAELEGLKAEWTSNE